MKILFATENSSKLREVRALFRSLSSDVELDTLSIDPDYVAPEETGKDFESNALLKARDAHAHFKDYIIIGDDSGLVVPALNGEPGIFSARYAGPEKNDSKNRAKLIEKIKTLKESQRQAYFQCSLAIIFPDSSEHTITGLCEGTLVEVEKGNNGFGYDSLFIKHDYDKTFAELSEEVKNKVSHRAKAFQQAIMLIEKKTREVNC